MKIGSGYALISRCRDEAAYMRQTLDSLATLWGWIYSALQRKPRYEDTVYRKFLRRYQWRALLVGNKRAIDEIYREMGRVADIFECTLQANRPRGADGINGKQSFSQPCLAAPG